MKEISVVIIVSQRRQALYGTMIGLQKSQRLPGELIIVNMNQPAGDLPTMPFPVRQITLYADAKLPLAAARNAGMAVALYEQLLFLDVDCIPAPDLISAYAEQWDDKQLQSGQVRYLKATSANAYDQERLHADSTPDPLRSGLAELPHELFWSLNFACSKALFASIGGFDDGFKGYGAEDTDFAFAARKRGVQLKNVPATAYHQHHDSYSPPLNHLTDIIQNANHFFFKWQIWPMEGWLSKFEEAGLIYRSDNAVSLLRMPTEAELRLAFKN